MAGGTDNNQLKLAAKTRGRWRQQFVDNNEDNNDDDNDKHGKHDNDDDEDDEHDNKDDNNNQLILAAKTRWRWQQRWKQQLGEQQRLPRAQQRLPWALVQTFSFVHKPHQERGSSLILSWFTWRNRRLPSPTRINLEEP